MTRDEMEERARALGVPFNSRTRDEVLAERISEVPGPENEQIDDSAISSATAPVMVRVICSNVWMDGVKHMLGDEFAAPLDIAEVMQDRNQVVIK